MGILRRARLLGLPLLVAALCLVLVGFPQEGLAAARAGLLLWANRVLPAILPFVIGANLLAALGGVTFAGIMLAPVMGRVFRLPGVGGFALAIGAISGYPIGAKVVCEIRGRGEISRGEGQRLISFVNNAGPLFVLGAVGVGMFDNAGFGRILLIAHYLGAVLVGLIFRFANIYDSTRYENVGNRPRALATLENARKNAPPFGQIMRDSVMNGLETMLLIGGFIMIFSVISHILNLTGIFGISDYAAGIFGGIIEMTTGIGNISHLGTSRATAAIVGFLISFGGISILFQSLAFISKTDIRPAPYILAKFIHGLAGGGFAWLLYPIL